MTLRGLSQYSTNKTYIKKKKSEIGTFSRHISKIKNKLLSLLTQTVHYKNCLWNKNECITIKHIMYEKYIGIPRNNINFNLLQSKTKSP